MTTTTAPSTHPRLDAVGAPEPFAYVNVGGSVLAVRRRGSGRPVVCVHAVGHGGGDFTRFASLAGDGFEIVTLDWPGQGRSPADGSPVRAKGYARLLLEACDVLGLERPIVVGNSIGAAAAAIAAADRPDRFAALVLCNPGGFAPLDAAARFVIGRMIAFFDAGARGAAWFPRAFAAYYRLAVLTEPASAPRRRLIVAAARELVPLLADAWRGFAEPEADIRGLVPRITVPVWLAWASGDRFVAWSRAKPALSALRRSRVTLFRGSHAPFLEAPERFAAEFRRFARDVEAGAV